MKLSTILERIDLTRIKNKLKDFTFLHNNNHQLLRPLSFCTSRGSDLAYKIFLGCSSSFIYCWYFLQLSLKHFFIQNISFCDILVTSYTMYTKGLLTKSWDHNLVSIIISNNACFYILALSLYSRRFTLVAYVMLMPSGGGIQ